MLLHVPLDLGPGQPCPDEVTIAKDFTWSGEAGAVRLHSGARIGNVRVRTEWGERQSYHPKWAGNWNQWWRLAGVRVVNGAQNVELGTVDGAYLPGPAFSFQDVNGLRASVRSRRCAMGVFSDIVSGTNPNVDLTIDCEDTWGWGPEFPTPSQPQGWNAGPSETYGDGAKRAWVGGDLCAVALGAGSRLRGSATGEGFYGVKVVLVGDFVGTFSGPAVDLDVRTGGLMVQGRWLQDTPGQGVVRIQSSTVVDPRLQRRGLDYTDATGAHWAWRSGGWNALHLVYPLTGFVLGGTYRVSREAAQGVALHVVDRETVHVFAGSRLVGPADRRTLVQDSSLQMDPGVVQEDWQS